MNITTTLTPENQKETGGDKWQLLVVVSVLGTLLGVVLLLGCLWVCMVYRKCCRRQRRPTWPEPDRGQESTFPPSQRATVDLGCLPDSLALRHPKQLNENTNNSGISRCLGLGMPYSTRQLPTLPTPMSWTPSPPFNHDRMHARERVCMVGGCRNRECELAETTEPLFSSRAPTSPSNPRYNTPTSGNYSNCVTRELDHQPEGRRHEEYEVRYTDRPYSYIRNGDQASKTSYSNYQRPCVEDYKHVENRWKYLPNRRRYLSVPTENPERMARGAACSNCQDPPPHHRHTSHGQHDYIPESSQVDPSRSRLVDNLASDPLADSRMDTLFVANDQREWFNRTTTHRLPATSNKEAGSTRTCQAPTTSPIPHLRLVKAVEHKCHIIPHGLSLISPATKPQWMSRYQASSDLGAWVPQRGECYPSRDPPERHQQDERYSSRDPPEHHHQRHQRDERYSSRDPPEHHHQRHQRDERYSSRDPPEHHHQRHQRDERYSSRDPPEHHHQRHQRDERYSSRDPPVHHQHDGRHLSRDPPEHHHQRHQHNGRYSSRDKPEHQHDLSDEHSQHDPDQEVRTRLALKYGFCQTCGVYTSPNQCVGVPADVCHPQRNNRSTQILGDGHNSSVNDIEELIHDPTPSMSWDNLTPDPLSILADTLSNRRTLDGTTIAAVLPSLPAGDIPHDGGGILHDGDDIPRNGGDIPHDCGDIPCDVGDEISSLSSVNTNCLTLGAHDMMNRDEISYNISDL